MKLQNTIWIRLHKDDWDDQDHPKTHMADADLYLLLNLIRNKETFTKTATVPSPSITKVRCIRRLYMCANRKLHSSELFHRSGPTYTPYHVMAESRPLYLLIRLIRSPLRLRRRYQAHPLLKYAAFVVYIYVPIANPSFFRRLGLLWNGNRMEIEWCVASFFVVN